MNQASYEEFYTRLKEAEIDLKMDDSDPTIVEGTVPADAVPAEVGVTVSEEPEYHVTDLGKYDFNNVKIEGKLQKIFTGKKAEAHIPSNSVIAQETLLRVRDALREYQRLPELDHNLIALFEEDRPVHTDQEALYSMAKTLDSVKLNDLFRHSLGMFENNGHRKKLESIDDLAKRGDYRNALEMLTILKMLADKSKKSVELYGYFGRKIITAAIDIYCHFIDNWKEYSDISQWEYETLLWAATEAQFHPDGIGDICRREIGMYDPNDDPELPVLKEISKESKEPFSDA